MSVEEALARLDRIQQTIVAHYTTPTRQGYRRARAHEDDDLDQGDGDYAIEMQAIQQRRETLERRGQKRKRLEEFDRAVDDAMNDVLSRAREVLSRKVNQLERLAQRLRGAAGYAAVAGGDGHARAAPVRGLQGRPAGRHRERERATAGGNSRRTTAAAAAHRSENTEDYKFAKKFFERQLSAYARIPTPWVFF